MQGVVAVPVVIPQQRRRQLGTKPYPPCHSSSAADVMTAWERKRVHTFSSTVLHYIADGVPSFFEGKEKEKEKEKTIVL